MEFRVFHAYMRLARRGVVDPLTCRHCGEEVGLRLGPDDLPLLQCHMCNSLVAPGRARYEEIETIVKEHS